MKKNSVMFWAIILGLFTCLLYGQDVVELSPEEIQENIVEDCLFERSIVWLDIRDDYEVENGIIASENCKPYHVSWNFDWDEKKGDLPKDIPIIIYCRTGRRALEAAEALIDSGYDPNMVAILKGGISAYSGDITTDSLMMKPWNELPMPSFPLACTGIRTIPKKSLIQRPVKSRKPMRFNLRGQVLKGSLVDPSAPVFILERIGQTSRKRVTGIQQLIQNER